MWVELGNDKPVALGRPVETSEVTEVTLDDDLSLSAAFVHITDPSGVWAHHSQAGTKPSWVDSDNDNLKNLLAEHYGCAQGRPTAVVADTSADD